MGGSVPVCGLPIGGVLASLQQDGDMFGVKPMAHFTAIFGPEVVVAQLDIAGVLFSRKGLAIDGSIGGLYRRLWFRQNKFSWFRTTIAAADHELRLKLHEQRLFEGIA